MDRNKEKDKVHDKEKPQQFEYLQLGDVVSIFLKSLSVIDDRD